MKNTPDRTLKYQGNSPSLFGAVALGTGVMIEPENTLDVGLPPHIVVAVTVEFASALSEENGVA